VVNLELLSKKTQPDYTFPTGETYVGQMKFGKPHGKGTKTDEN